MLTWMNCCAVHVCTALGFAASPGGSATSTSRRSPPEGTKVAGEPGSVGIVLTPKLVT